MHRPRSRTKYTMRSVRKPMHSEQEVRTRNEVERHGDEEDRFGETKRNKDI